MHKLVAFNSTTMDGYFADANGGISWAHQDIPDAEFDEFVADNAKEGGLLILGRITYELMAGFWPTALAAEHNPGVAEQMNSMSKVVFSRTLSDASWSNTTLVKTDMAAEVRRLKQSSGKDMAILGSGTVVSQLAQEGLIDEFQIVVNPVVLGRGRTMFDGITAELSLKLTKSRTFASGKVLLCYAPR